METTVGFRQRADFPVLQSLQTGSGDHPAADSVSNICSSPGVKRSEHEANNSFPPGVDFKTDQNRISSATHVFVAFAVTSPSLRFLLKEQEPKTGHRDLFQGAKLAVS